MGGTFFALAFLAFTSLTTGGWAAERAGWRAGRRLPFLLACSCPLQLQPSLAHTPPCPLTPPSTHPPACLLAVDIVLNERLVVAREVRGGYYSPAAYLLSKLTLDACEEKASPGAPPLPATRPAPATCPSLHHDPPRRIPSPPLRLRCTAAAVLLRVVPAVIYWAAYYYLAGYRYGSTYAATYVLVLITFSCCIGALSMAVTGGWVRGWQACVKGMAAVWVGRCMRGAAAPRHAGMHCLQTHALSPLRQSSISATHPSFCPPPSAASRPALPPSAVASNTAGQASFTMNVLLLFSLVYTGFLVNINSIHGEGGFGGRGRRAG